jgi:hypothetical protein
MNDHRACEASLSIGIKQSMRDSGPFVDLTSYEGSNNNVKEKPEEEDEEAALALEYEWFIRGDTP